MPTLFKDLDRGIQVLDPKTKDGVYYEFGKPLWKKTPYFDLSSTIKKLSSVVSVVELPSLLVPAAYCLDDRSYIWVLIDPNRPQNVVIDPRQYYASPKPILTSFLSEANLLVSSTEARLNIARHQKAQLENLIASED